LFGAVVPAVEPEPTRTKPMSDVFVVRSNQAVGTNGRPNREFIRSALDNLVGQLAGEQDARDAWEKLIHPKPSDAVGIKINCLGGTHLQSSPEIVWAIVERLKSIGVNANQIIIWDRRDDELRKCGYSLNSSAIGMRCYGTLPTRGYTDSTRPLGAKQIRLSNILADEISILINVPVLKDHNVAGVTGALKNHYGSFNIPWSFHGKGCEAAAHLNATPEIREKTRLIVLDALRPQCHGGPGNRPKYRWDLGALIASHDPVALDAIGWEIIEQKRAELGLPSLKQDGREPRYIRIAESFGLGNARRENIKLVEHAI
jgi:uncharacterized protein (DUF362 family)